MVDYRIYKLDSFGKLIGAPRIIQCDNDDTALITTLKYIGEEAVEIWQGARRVLTIPTEHGPDEALHAGSDSLPDPSD